MSCHSLTAWLLMYFQVLRSAWPYFLLRPYPLRKKNNGTLIHPANEKMYHNDGELKTLLTKASVTSYSQDVTLHDITIM